MRAMEGISMRYAASTALLLGLVATSGVFAQQPIQMPAHWMNCHPPFIIHNSYWHPGPYSFWGSTDRPTQPVRHIGPPPFGPRWWYAQPVWQCAGGECGYGMCDNGMCYAPGQPGQPPAPGQPPTPAPPGMWQPGVPPGPCGWWRSPRDYFMLSY